MEKKFNSEKEILEHLFKENLGNSKECPSCGEETSFYMIEKKKRYVTKCGHSVFPTKGTPFYKSSTPLMAWYKAIEMMKKSDGQVSAKEIERELGVTYKTAWRIKKILKEEN